jgi:hypothetical protein
MNNEENQTRTIITDGQARALGRLAARTQLRQVEEGYRRELNRNAAWCAERERLVAIRTSEGYDAWHDGWAEEVEADAEEKRS